MSQSAQNDTSEQAEFRQHCRDWLRNNTPAMEISDPTHNETALIVLVCFQDAATLLIRQTTRKAK